MQCRLNKYTKHKQYATPKQSREVSDGECYKGRFKNILNSTLSMAKKYDADYIRNIKLWESPMYIEYLSVLEGYRNYISGRIQYYKKNPHFWSSMYNDLNVFIRHFKIFTNDIIILRFKAFTRNIIRLHKYYIKYVEYIGLGPTQTIDMAKFHAYEYFDDSYIVRDFRELNYHHYQLGLGNFEKRLYEIAIDNVKQYIAGYDLDRMKYLNTYDEYKEYYKNPQRFHRDRMIRGAYSTLRSFYILNPARLRRVYEQYKLEAF